MKTVVVTGVTQGIGKAIHDYLSSKQYKVIGIDSENNSHCQHFIKGDLSDLSFLESLPKLIEDKISGIVHNAAIQIEKNLVETSYEEWNRVFAVNVHAPFYITKILKDKFEKSAAIVNISSVHAKATSTGLAAYGASKGALSAMTRSMALELGASGIRVNAVLPGAIETPMLMKGLSRNGDPKIAAEQLKSASPIHQIGKPEDIAKLVHFLLDATLSGNITGQEFVCDSGILARLASE